MGEKTREVIRLKGEVQGVGLRGSVIRLANTRGLTGTIENLADATVRIIIEGPPAEIDELKEMIKQLDEEIEVEELIVESSTTATDEFEGFTMVVTDLTHLAIEIGQGFGTAKYHLNKLGEKVDRVGEKVDLSREETKKGFTTLGEKVDLSREETKKGFTTLGEKVDLSRQEMKDGFTSLGKKVDQVGDRMPTIDRLMQFMEAERKAREEMEKKLESKLGDLTSQIEDLRTQIST